MRVLGKDGFVVITAVADPSFQDDLIQANSLIVNSVNFEDGYKYSDFNPSKDHLAEWTIGGLIAGKVLAKTGLWAILAKFSKIIILGIIGFFALLGKKIVGWFRRRKEENFSNDDDDEFIEPEIQT